jgi:TM2 domain-containing membrane protein YozV
MKASYLATFLSACVFPGIGQLYLKRYRRGLVIMAIALSGLGFMVWSVTVYILKHLDAIMNKIQGGTTNLQEIVNIVRSETSAATPYYDGVFYLIVCLWIFSIIDAYRIGKRRETHDKNT